MDYYSYMNYYTIRSGVMQFVGNVAAILICHGIDHKMRQKAQAVEEVSAEA